MFASEPLLVRISQVYFGLEDSEEGEEGLHLLIPAATIQVVENNNHDFILEMRKLSLCLG